MELPGTLSTSSAALGAPFELKKPDIRTRRPRALTSPPATSPSSSPPGRTYKPCSLTEIFDVNSLETSYQSENPSAYLQEYIMTLPGSEQPFVSVKTLLSFCALVFTPLHVAQISRYYTGMDDLSAFTCMATYGSITCSLVTDVFMWSETQRAELSSALADANNEGWNTVGKGGKTVQTGSMASGRRGGNGNDEGGDGGRRGGRKGGQGGGRGGRGRGDQPEERPQGKRFREATHYTLQLPAFTTPPKDDSFPTLEDITSRNFANLTMPGGLSRYDPDEDDEGMGNETQRTLIHGTRSSSLPKFMFNGILPPAHPNTLCQGPAFYTTTHAECAYLHTLLHHPRILSPDPVALLIFNISPPIIHGNRHIDNHPLFSFLWFKTQDQDSLIEHATTCMNSNNILSPLSTSPDFVIGPHLVLNREGTTVYIPQFPYLPAGTQPTQVAAGTEVGWVYLSSCLDAIVIEKRVSEIQTAQFEA